MEHPVVIHGRGVIRKAGGVLVPIISLNLLVINIASNQLYLPKGVYSF